MFSRLLLVLTALLLTITPMLGQLNCNNTSTGNIPINDLGTSTFQGRQGGLYPGGVNVRPVAHTDAGISLASTIQPLDVNGQPDPVNGSIVLIGIGMSNTRIEFTTFEDVVDTAQNINPQLVVISTGQNRQDLNVASDTTDVFWRNIEDTLTSQGYSLLQVQAIWFKEAKAFPTNPNFDDYVNTLVAQMTTCMHKIDYTFPNCQLVYISSRIYGAYGPASFPLNPEPWAHYNGWGVKTLIEAQINGDPNLAFDGSNPTTPWLSWGPYLWADGVNARNDGLQWLCPDDYAFDGWHPSEVGSAKVANYLLDFFKTDPTTVGWFLDNTPTSVDEPFAAIPEKFTVSNFPNPFNSSTVFSFSLPSDGNVSLKIYDVNGREVAQILGEYRTAGQHRVSWTANLPSGIYFYQLRSADQVMTRKLALMN